MASDDSDSDLESISDVNSSDSDGLAVSECEDGEEDEEEAVVEDKQSCNDVEDEVKLKELLHARVSYALTLAEAARNGEFHGIGLFIDCITGALRRSLAVQGDPRSDKRGFVKAIDDIDEIMSAAIAFKKALA